ncbi:benzoate 4-monooxygenase cytochrome P450 [Verticillium alfalfae VaMs.102]|uniref:Benzoate 4-monooxygenase cytochrome P450 n=1 Tax=Verticillium alfalfae (strain VaMs.102 / ATCC MYA-4576 / FGSC 10136) TaxID=526221 RepID=C9SYR3_VERA1|nr:benzoate 4-monooxygenase cytochrome P450 [Verticillium alfalfae VaMs.102]EEY23928.1 benzoate 4-monooxygenase cytochrome P450 [Verticillium alfalfae VaMs.102]
MTLSLPEIRLPSPPLLSGLLIAGFVLLLARAYHGWRRLSHIPGPFLWSLSPFPLLRANLIGQSHQILSDLTTEYGPLVRIGPNAVLTTDYRHCQKMEAHKSPYRKGPWYGTFRFQKGVDHSFAMLDEARHTALRTKVGHGYSGTMLVVRRALRAKADNNGDQEQAIDRQLERFFRIIDGQYITTPSDHKPLDLSVITQFLALDIVGDMTFGKPFGFLDKGEDIYDWIKWNEGFFPIASTAATLPFLASLVQKWPFSEALPKPTDKDVCQTNSPRRRAAQDTLDERFEPGAQPRNDMIAQFLKHGATKAEATSEALVQVQANRARAFLDSVAGTDSVAVALRMAVLYVLSTPRVYYRLLSEIEGAAAKGEVSSPIRDAEAKKLPYLQAVIREACASLPRRRPSSTRRFRLAGMSLLLLRRYDFTINDPTLPVRKLHSAAFWMMEGFWVTVGQRQTQ